MRARRDQDSGTAGSAALRMRLLGAPRITLDGAPVPELTSTKAQALLFYLAVTGRMHSRAALAALLWGDFPEAAARGNLRKALQQLREHLGAHLRIERDTVALAPEADWWVDAVEFDALLQQGTGSDTPQRAQRAIDLYQGDFLEGFYVRHAPDFESWSLSERARLREMKLEALHALAEHHAAQGDLEAAIDFMRRFLDLEPWREEAHRRVMTWLALSGQRGAALAQYEECRLVLADELDVEPAEQTTVLYEQIRDGDLQPLPAAQAGLLTVEPQRPAFLDEQSEPAVTPEVPFVRREAELDRLAGFLEAALAGRAQVALVSGEAGWGKTRLMDEFSQRAREVHPDLLVASGTCTTFTGAGDPYLPFREILRRLSADVEQEWAAGTITRRHALDLWHALPQVVDALVTHGPHLLDTLLAAQPLLQRAAAHDGVGPRLLGLLQGAVSDHRGESRAIRIGQERIFAEVADVLRAVSQTQPLLLILDDLHWADVSSIGLLFHLGRQLPGCPCLVLGAYRPEDVALGREGEEHPLLGVLDEFKRLYGDVWVHLAEEENEGRRFVDALLDTEPNRLGEGFRYELSQSTRGHPLFTVEILRDMEEHGHIQRDEGGRWVEGSAMHWDALPRRVEGVIERRIHRLDPRLRDVLATASVEGETFTAEVLARVRQVSVGEMVGLLSGGLSHRHGLVRAGGVRRVNGTRISRYRFSHSLFQKHLYHSLDPVERAYLHEAVGDALEALYQGATDEIAPALARHFAEAGRRRKEIAHLKRAGDAAGRIYANAEAVGHYRQAIEVARDIQDAGSELTVLYLRLGRSLELDSRFDQALDVYRRMGSLAQERDDRHMELASLMARATVQSVPTAVHDPEQARLLGEQALTLADRLGDQAAEAKILWGLCLANQWAGRWHETIECGERSLDLARQLDLRGQMAQTLNDLGGVIYLYTGRIDKAKASLRQASELWRELGDVPMLADSLASSSAAHVFSGDYNRAIALSDEAFEISRSIDNLWGESHSRWKVGYALWDRGQVSRAITVMQTAIRLGDRAGFAPSQTSTRSELAALYADMGAVAQGLETARVALSSGEKLNYFVDRAKILGILMHLHLLDGDVAQAQARIEEVREDPYRESWPVLFVPSVLAEAELVLEQGAHARCVTVVDGLLTDLRRWGMRAYVSDALYVRGLALERSGELSAARESFLEAHANAEAIGSRRSLWRILRALSRIEEEPTEAETLRRKARETVRYVVGHIGQTELRASFLSLPDVRAILTP